MTWARRCFWQKIRLQMEAQVTGVKDGRDGAGEDAMNDSGELQTKYTTRRIGRVERKTTVNLPLVWT